MRHIRWLQRQWDARQVSVFRLLNGFIDTSKIRPPRGSRVARYGSERTALRERISISDALGLA